MTKVSDKNIDNIDNFIKNYTPKDKENLDYSWNGKEGDSWRDENSEFRDKVSARILSKEIPIPEILLRDIFLAEAMFCRETWGSTFNVSKLGTLLLETTHEKYIEDYFIGKHQSFDTQCAVSLGDVSLETQKTILKAIRETGIQCKSDEFQMSDVVEYMEKYIAEHYEEDKQNR